MSNMISQNLIRFCRTLTPASGTLGSQGNEETMTPELIYSEVTSKLNFYETHPLFECIDIQHHEYVKPFFDFDLKQITGTGKKQVTIPQEEWDDFKVKEESIFQEAVDFFCNLFSVDPNLLAVSIASCDDKISYHATITNMKVKYAHLMQLMKLHQKQMEKLHLDASVYSSYRKFRIVNTSKFGENRPLHLLTFDSTPEEWQKHLITHVADLPEFEIKLPESSVQSLQKLVRKVDPIAKPPSACETTSEYLHVSVEELDQVCALLDKSRFHNGKEWIDVGQALFNCNSSLECLAIWDRYSQTSSKYDNEICAKRWNSFKQGSISIGTLKRWALEDSPDAYQELYHPKPKGCQLLDECDAPDSAPAPQKITIKPKVLTKLDAWHIKTFVSKDKDDNYVIINLKAFMDYMNQYLIVVTSNPCIIELDYTDRARPYEIRTIEKTMSLYKTNTFAFKKWFENPNRKETKLPEWIPFTLTPVKTDQFNLFVSLKHKMPAIDDLQQGRPVTPQIQPMLDHIREVYANNDAELFQYIMSWFAWKVQKPNQKIGTALVIKSELHGAGKNIVFDFLQMHVIGEQYCRSIDNLDSLLGKFNAGSEHSLLVCLDEIGKKGVVNHENHNRIKSLITRKRQEIEQKGIDSRPANDYNDYIMFSNNNWVVLIEPSDRRFCCCEASNRYAGNTKYFTDLVATCMNDEAGKYFFEYLLAFDISNFIPSQIPVTSWKRDLREKSLPPMIRAITELIQCNLDSTETTWFISEFQDYYDNLKIDSKYKEKLSSGNFSKKLCTILDTPSTRSCKDKIRKAGIKISIPELQDRMRILLKDPKLIFTPLEESDHESQDDEE
jgi:hypothetical protein